MTSTYKTSKNNPDLGRSGLFFCIKIGLFLAEFEGGDATAVGGNNYIYVFR